MSGPVAKMLKDRLTDYMGFGIEFWVRHNFDDRGMRLPTMNH